MKTYLITGGCGFLGSNMARRALALGHRVIIFDNLSRLGAQTNLQWLGQFGSITFVHGDIRNTGDVFHLLHKYRPEVIFHLAGQVAMTTSLQRPRLDFEVNALGTFNLLEGVRMHVPEALTIYSSTNKVYGDLEHLTYHEEATRYSCLEYPQGFDEQLSLNFQSPYGCSKGCADQYMLDYARMFGLKTLVFRHSSLYGDRQFATFDQGWIGWFCQKALQAHHSSEPFTISGDGKQVRDVLHVEDAVDLYFSAVDHADALQGCAFNIGGGMSNSLSLLELFSFLESLTGTPLSFTKTPWRLSDQKIFVANLHSIQHHLPWSPKISSREGIQRMLSWLQEPASL